MSRRPFISVVQETASPKPEVRLHAAAVLSGLGGTEAEEALAGLLSDSDHRVRARAVEGLAHAGPAGRATCTDILLDPASGVAGPAAARALAARGGAGGVLLEALSSPSPVVRLRAARELPPGASGPAVVAALEAAVRTETDADVRVELLLALGRTGRTEAVPVLLRALRDGGTFDRAHAAWALGLLGDPRAAARLLPLLDEPGVGACALAALSRLPAPEAAEELARRGARDPAAGPDLLVALSTSVCSAPGPVARRVRALWPSVTDAAQAALAAPGLPRGAAGALARLLARLDAAGAAALVVRHGPYPDGYGPLAELPPERLVEAARTALVVDDPEPALVLLVHGGVAVDPARLLAHSHPRAKTGALNRLVPGSTPLPDLLEILADDDPDTALAAAWAVSREAWREDGERARAAATALHDRASGHDGPGRAAALTALREQPGPAADGALRSAFGSSDAGTRAAAAAASAFRSDLTERDVLPLLEDDDPTVRAEALRTLTRLAGDGRSAIDSRRILRFLNDDAQVAAAAGALLVTLAGAERPRLAREMLAQRGAVRRAALETIGDLRDAASASAVAFAVLHEDVSTARAVLEAAAAAPPPIAADAVVSGLADRRPEVRIAAAAAAARAGEDLAAALGIPLAEALDRESDPEARAALLRAIAASGRADAIGAVTRALGTEAERSESRAAAESLARRFPEAVRGAWGAAPPRAGRAWGAAIEAARRPGAPAFPDDGADALRLLAGLARMRTGLDLDTETLRPRLGLLLGAEAWAAGSFRQLWRRMRDLPPSHALLARLVDSVADTTSRFFGDPAALDALAGEIAPERLLALGADGTLDVWCVACGTGEEAWSVAIRLAERGFGPNRRFRIRGTDLSPAAIRHAKAGVYGPHALRGVAEAVRTRHFQPLSNGRYRVREPLREAVYFEARALADEPPGAGKHDVIICHGLLAQLPAAARPETVERLGACLKPGGYLLLGREDHAYAASSPLAPVLLGSDLAYRTAGAVVYTRALS
ncbi:MAG TPA: CheR family methyltransferase [Thermoanaerobaculia bacterium]